MSKKALGKGLSALISTEDDGDILTKENQFELPINLLRAGKGQPRTYFEESKLEELAESIKNNGILQPILVRKLENQDSYEIIAGERRFRAAKMIGLENIPVIIKDLDDKQSLEIALIENIQRENLTPIEEAEGYKRLQDELEYTQEQLSGILGKSRSHIANMLRLLGLPQSVKDLVNSGALSMGHARVLVGMDDPQSLAERIVSEGLNVREAEKFLTKKDTDKANKKEKIILKKDDDVVALEKSLSDSIGLKVIIQYNSDGGRVILHFNNLAELDRILQRIG